MILNYYKVFVNLYLTIIFLFYINILNTIKAVKEHFSLEDIDLIKSKLLEAEISKKKLLYKHTEKTFSKMDMSEFKKDYSKLTRRVNHNSMQNLVHLHLAEQIFRFNHNYDEVYNEITRFI